MAKIKGREIQTQGQHNDVLSKIQTEALGVKPLCYPPSGKYSTKE